MNGEHREGASEPQIVDLASFRKKKEVARELTRSGRSPLYVSHLSGKVTGNPAKAEGNGDFGDRLQRIRASLEKINRLMFELKKMSAETEPAPAPISSASRTKI